jgi:hypothetical protein
MTKKGFSVIGELYRFLGEFDRDAILAACSHRGISPNIKAALEALAREARHVSIARDTAGSRADSGPTKNGSSLSRELPDAVYRKNLERFLGDPRRFPDKPSLVAFARTIGVSQEPPVKASRLRVASTLTNAIVSNPTLREAVAKVVAGMGDEQTAGWMNLILRER